MIGGSRNLGVTWQQSSICGAYATGVWVPGDCEVAEMEVRITRSLAGVGPGIDFAGRGEGRGGKSQGCSALGSGASILVHWGTSQALISYFGLPQVSFPSIISS